VLNLKAVQQQSVGDGNADSGRGFAPGAKATLL
jgi:hypothetical protein